MQHIKTVKGFFYGLYMDNDLLISLGYHPEETHMAKLKGHEIDFCGRVKIYPKTGCEVWGNIISLPEEDIKKMYAGEQTKDYFPNQMEAITIDNNKFDVVCYTLPLDGSSAINIEYLQKLMEIAVKNQLPLAYVNALKEKLK